MLLKVLIQVQLQCSAVYSAVHCGSKDFALRQGLSLAFACVLPFWEPGVPYERGTGRLGTPNAGVQ